MNGRECLLRPAAARFSWRDALAFCRAVPRLALHSHPHLPPTALARIYALDVRDLPQREYFTASDGGQIAFRRYEGGSTTHLVLIHGSACYGDQLHTMALRLSRAGQATVYTLDMRGHGGSDPFPDDFNRFACDIQEFCNALSEEKAGRTIVVGGHSAGGGLVINAAGLTRQSVVAGWLLIAPYISLNGRSMRPFFGGWVNKFDLARMGRAILANLIGSKRYNQEPVVHFNRDAYLHDPRFVREWPFSAVFGFGPGAVARGKRPFDSSPVLMIYGDSDNCFSPDGYQRDFHSIAPTGECRSFARLGHWDVLVDNSAISAVGQWLEDKFGKGREETPVAPSGPNDIEKEVKNVRIA